ncbi:hypothetical protein O6H91_08G029800 [Diphasiastrum complanatum]|uniref:Uncharacterized protein n=1 Tax=Diphasiastrum complanatum TaxID=34168 RepID=A0ACC2CW08_DIPCM|nr:hypothetical protein O6H91_08G029800 [Diphasiastrum complanatum]
MDEEYAPDINKKVSQMSLSSGKGTFSLASSQSDSEYDEEEDDKEEPLVLLGFAQDPQHPWLLARHHFPSKAGGSPAWLDPVNLPQGKDTLCGFCENPLEFLCQVYAPLDGREDAFHRTMFLFMCPNLACLQQDQHHQSKPLSEKPCRSVKVFRSQLRRTNRYYSKDPPRSDGSDSPSCGAVALCSWCGTWRGEKVCGGCKQTRYCSRKHQLDHWRAGHANYCREVQAGHDQKKGSTLGVNEAEVILIADSKRLTEQGIAIAANTATWPEFEITVEEERDEDISDSEHKSSESAVVLAGVRKGDNFPLADFQDVEEPSKEQQHWASFQARISRAPSQVLRYCRSADAKPLWLQLDGQPQFADIPPCTSCGQPRIFEFQVLPQLLYYLGVQNNPDSLDWGTIAIYTCASSCSSLESSSTSIGYVEEFVWVEMAS